MHQLDAALKLLLELGYAPKWIAHKTGIGYHRVLRSDPERYKTARIARARRKPATSCKS